MKKLATLFQFVGFIVQYILPIALFGDIIPYTKEGIGKCLTGMGYVAIGLALYFCIKKFKEWLLQKPKSIKRALILSVFPIVIWLAIMLGLDFLNAFIMKISAYWSKIIIFILLGRGCYVVSEGLSNTEEGAKQ
jgi:putative Mn2+ efflux pump MntP